MENFRGTKGKWFLKEKSDGCSTISGEGWEDFCEINTITDGTDFENTFYNISKANAQLIANSPLLLDAIKNSIDKLREVGLNEMADYHEKLYNQCVIL